MCNAFTDLNYDEDEEITKEKDKEIKQLKADIVKLLIFKDEVREIVDSYCDSDLAQDKIIELLKEE